MKILLVVEATLGGSGRHAVDLAGGLLKRDHEVHLVYSRLRADRNFIAGLDRLNAAHSRFQGHEIPINRELSPFDFVAYLKLCRVVRQYGPFDIIHSHSTKAGFLSRLLVGRSGTRSVYTPHGLMTMDPRLPRSRRIAVSALESLLSRFCSAVIVVSPMERACARRAGIATNNLVVIPNGIDAKPEDPTERDRIRSHLGLNPDEVCVGWVGRFTDYKCPDRMLEAFAKFSLKVSKPARLVMIGAGPLAELLLRQAANLGIANKVLFMGEADGPAHMPAFDILAHTSLFEGFAYVFLEALSVGVPVVTTNVGATAELVEESVTGHVCDPWDPERFAGLLQEIVDKPENRAFIARAARQRVARYSTTAMVGATVALYESLRRQNSRDGDRAAVSQVLR